MEPLAWPDRGTALPGGLSAGEDRSTRATFPNREHTPLPPLTRHLRSRAASLRHDRADAPPSRIPGALSPTAARSVHGARHRRWWWPNSRRDVPPRRRRSTAARRWRAPRWLAGQSTSGLGEGRLGRPLSSPDGRLSRATPPGRRPPRRRCASPAGREAAVAGRSACAPARRARDAWFGQAAWSRFCFLAGLQLLPPLGEILHGRVTERGARAGRGRF
jgi:hypothetical protein